ncbi:hypothetical protein NQ315_008033 [Exocentrus adspersus]|uniref:Uncharacterized protein n=1 Tax=Exocentrus adspersus TaxID=1586481 RepID=A0AAV8VVX9_9CUCU|nr:hypothetical protein NQ315_008033 [Exocentrus adspersus]
MDCCNYMQYRHHQPYYGSQYYHEPLPPYHGEFYGHHVYHDYYGNTPYYPPQHWQHAGTFATPDYVYNPKEARIRKAMREATRDRSIGASPMLPRPSARIAATQGWAPGSHEDQLMMSPMASAGMRRVLDSPVCFPMPCGTGSSQFMPPPMGAGYGKLEPSLPPPPPPPPTNGSSVHTNYMQPNPLAQLQQQTEMWHNYQDEMRPRSSEEHVCVAGNPYMMQEVPAGFQHQPSPPLSIPSPMMIDKQRQTPHALNPVTSSSMPLTPPLSNISMTPPHSNENVPPEESLQMCKPTGGAEDCFEPKHMIDPCVQPLMENNMQQNDGFMPLYGQNLATQFEKVDDAKMKKVSGSKKPSVPQQIRISAAVKKKPIAAVLPKPLPDFNEAFGSTERGRFQSPPDPRRLAPSNKGYLDFFYEDEPQIKFEDYQT